LAALDPAVVVVAGDTFDSPQVDRTVVEEAARCLSTARNSRGEHVPVVIIPGNHDPAEEERLWQRFQQSVESPSVSVALLPQLISIAEGKLFVEAYPCTLRYSPAPPWEKRLSLPAASQSACRVVVAHGTLQGGPVPEGETDAYPFGQEDLTSLAAEYVALGHFHGVYPAWPNREENRQSYCYSGTHEPDQFGTDAGYAILAELRKGQPAELRRLKIGRRTWREISLVHPPDLSGVEALRQSVAGSEHPAHFVIRLRMESRSGWPADRIKHFRRLESTLRTLGAQVELRGELRSAIDVRTLDLSGLPSGAIKEALFALQAGLATCADEREREVIAAAIQIGCEKMQEAMA
jgi:DNA repair exonuclease SbcCD nuclease subunit